MREIEEVLEVARLHTQASGEISDSRRFAQPVEWMGSGMDAGHLENDINRLFP